MTTNETTGNYLKVNGSAFSSDYDFQKLRIILFEYIIAKEVEWSLGSNCDILGETISSKITYSKLLLHPLIITFGNGSSKSLFETISNFKYKYKFGIISTNFVKIIKDDKEKFAFFSIDNDLKITIRENYRNLTIQQLLEKIKDFEFDTENSYFLSKVEAKKNNPTEYGKLTDAVDTSFSEIKRKFYNLLDLDIDVLIKYFLSVFQVELTDFDKNNKDVLYMNVESKLAY